MNEFDELVDIAPRGTATQSSLSQWSLPTGAAALVQSLHQDFLIHTEFELNPWWQIDLRHIFPLHRIIVGNRREVTYQERACHLRVETSVDGNNWQFLHVGLSYFGDGLRTPGMVIELNDHLFARYVRLSLIGFQALHLSSLQILSRKNHQVVADFWDRFQLAVPNASEARDPDRAFKVVKVGNALGMNINGLKIRAFGRMGNNFIQIINAVHLAEYLGIKTVLAPKIAFGGLNNDVHTRDLSLIAGDSSAPDGYYLESTFFFIHQPDVYRTLSPQRKRLLAETLIMPLIGAEAVVPSETTSRARELAVHIRSGDIFSDDPHPEYIQPPLSFYTMIVEQLLSNGLIDTVAIVAEDRRNPCVDALEAWLRARHVPSRLQSGTLFEDVNFLRYAEYVVYGYGTFGYGVSLIAGHIKRLYSFGMQYTLTGIPNVRELYIYDDQPEGYIERGRWKNTPYQRSLMLDYPAERMKRIT